MYGIGIWKTGLLLPLKSLKGSVLPLSISSVSYGENSWGKRARDLGYSQQGKTNKRTWEIVTVN